MDQYSQTAGLLGGVIVFITFFYSNLNEEFKNLLDTDEIQCNTEKMLEWKKEILHFICIKWLPLVILPAVFCDIIIISAFINKSLDPSFFGNILKSLPEGICFLEILILFVYTVASVSSMIKLIKESHSLSSVKK